MRLALVIDTLGPGGAQRVLSAMASFWASRGRSVALVTLEGGGVTPTFALDPAVTLVRLGTIGSSRNALRRAWGKARHLPALRAALAQARPDVVVSFIDRVNVMTLLATKGLSLPVVVSERTEPSAYPLGFMWNELRRRTYPAAAALVAQTAAALRYFPPAPGRIDRVIPNPVIPAPKPGGPSSPRRRRHLVLGMGRLGPEKGFDHLLAAFARLAGEFPDWDLEIWGEGSERVALERLGTDLGLGTRARLPGLTAHPAEQFSSADVFALTSRFEGFPNALCEAMAAGLPVISYDCPSGPREIVRHQVDGLLVPPEGGVKALAQALARLMGDSAERQRLAARGPEVVDRFGLERIMGLWDSLLADVLGSAGRGAQG